MRLDGPHEQAITRPLSHDELVQLHGGAAQARVAADLPGALAGVWADLAAKRGAGPWGRRV